MNNKKETLGISQETERICIFDESHILDKLLGRPKIKLINPPRIVTAKTIAWKKALLDEFNQEKSNCEITRQPRS